MRKGTNFNFDICNWASDGVLNEFKCIYTIVLKLLNETKAIDKQKTPLLYTESLNKTKEQVDELVEKFKLLIEKEHEGICCLETKLKEIFYELTGQVYAMYASNTNHLEYEGQAQ